MSLGISGWLARTFIRSPLTPLILIASVVAGLIGLNALPREEEPQISVPLVDIQVSAPGLKAPDAAKLVTEPLEEIVKAIDGVEHVYSETRDDQAVVTARFVVGADFDDAMVRVHEKVRANINHIPIGIPEPLIIGRGVDDVAILTATLAPEPDTAARWTPSDLLRLAEELQAVLSRVPDVGLSYITGGAPFQIRIEPDPERLALHGVTLQALVGKLTAANRSFAVGQLVDGDRALPAIAGQTLQAPSEIGQLLLTTRDGRPVYVADVAEVSARSAPLERHVWQMTPVETESGEASLVRTPAVTLAFAKRPGANAVDITHALRARIDALEGDLIPDGVTVEITRDYGETAKEKADELLFHLGLATISIVALVALAIGLREGAVVLIVIPTTILITMFASWQMGYTINRVSLFALIFSIGILVDDAIVVIENIARHWGMKDGRSRAEAAVDAVAEVGNPTIVATLTVVAALLPMLFVSGLMGPYMSPIPANASAAMIFSFFVAVIITPWLMLRLAGGAAPAGDGEASGHESSDGGRLGRGYRFVAQRVIASRGRAILFLVLVAAASIGSTALFATRDVTVKLLPFDDKSEIQAVIDLPEGASLEATDAVLHQAALRLADLPELVSIQSHAGTAAPFNFNGLVRHAFLRRSPELGDLQINLAPKTERERPSHTIALEIRERLAGLAAPEGTVVKVVEAPPGPPVLATLLAEVYGPDAETRRETARRLRGIFEEIPFIVDVDDSFGQPADRVRIAIEQDNLEYHSVSEADVYDTIAAWVGGSVVGYSHRGEGRAPIEIAVAAAPSDLTLSERLLSIPVPANALPGGRGIVELGDVVTVTRETASYPIFRRNGLPAEMVMAELAGAYEAPVYGLIAVGERIDALDWGAAGRPEIRLNGQPEADRHPIVLWDGEWEVTWVTFRDMGLAFGIAILGVFALVVGQFGSFRLPLVVLTPVPLTLIGIMLGHWMLGAAFTATSMIGFIALAGIIVRNSILLIDFIRHARTPDRPLRDVLLEAGAIRFKPILLTALAAMIGAAVILADPIFQGLAISLLFGLASSTLLTVLVIPAIYVALRDDGRPASTLSA